MGAVVADGYNHRLCVFRLSGELVVAVGSSEQGLCKPCDVLECTSDGSFIVANYFGHNLLKIFRDADNVVRKYGKKGSGDGQFMYPVALAALPDGGLAVLENQGGRFQVFNRGSA